MTHEKAPGPFLWTLAWGFFASFKNIVEREEKTDRWRRIEKYCTCRLVSYASMKTIY